MIRTLVLAFLVLMSTSASAATLVWRLDLPTAANMSLTWGSFGDDRGQFTGEVVSTTLVLSDFTTTGAQDAADFFFTFDIPALGDESHIGLTGAELGWSGTGAFNHSFTTDRFNGELREGRFGMQLDGAGGWFAGESYLEITVEGFLPDELFADSFDEFYDEEK